MITRPQNVITLALTSIDKLTILHVFILCIFRRHILQMDIPVTTSSWGLFDIINNNNWCPFTTMPAASTLHVVNCEKRSPTSLILLQATFVVYHMCTVKFKISLRSAQSDLRATLSTNHYNVKRSQTIQFLLLSQYILIDKLTVRLSNQTEWISQLI